MYIYEYIDLFVYIVIVYKSQILYIYNVIIRFDMVLKAV